MEDKPLIGPSTVYANGQKIEGPLPEYFLGPRRGGIVAETFIHAPANPREAAPTLYVFMRARAGSQYRIWHFGQN